MEDKFFSQKHCDRCGGDLISRTMSWFTQETICLSCSVREDEIKEKLREIGEDSSKYEGCGYIPTIIGGRVRDFNN